MGVNISGKVDSFDEYLGELSNLGHTHDFLIAKIKRLVEKNKDFEAERKAQGWHWEYFDLEEVLRLKSH